MLSKLGITDVWQNFGDPSGCDCGLNVVKNFEKKLNPACRDTFATSAAYRLRYLRLVLSSNRQDIQPDRQADKVLHPSKTIEQQTGQVLEPPRDVVRPQHKSTENPALPPPADRSVSRKRRRSGTEAPSKKQKPSRGEPKVPKPDDIQCSPQWPELDKHGGKVTHGEIVRATLISTKSCSLDIDQVDLLVAMVLGIGSPNGFLALKARNARFQQDRGPYDGQLFSDIPKDLMESLDRFEESSDLLCIFRRVTLCRMANIYKRSCASLTTQAQRSKALISFVEKCTDVPFPSGYDGQLTKRGHIKADTPEATQWNQRKTKVQKRIQTGQHWLRLAEKFGWSTLLLTARGWTTPGSTHAVLDSQ